MEAEQKDSGSSFQEIRLWKGGSRIWNECQLDGCDLMIWLQLWRNKISAQVSVCVCVCVSVFIGWMRCRSAVLCSPLWRNRDPSFVCFFFFLLCDPAYRPAVKNHVSPLKTGLLQQIKLNNVRAVNPCVFQQLKPPHPPLRMSASGPLSSPLALLPSCQTPSPWPRQQPAALRLSALLWPRKRLCVHKNLSLWISFSLKLHFSLLSM